MFNRTKTIDKPLSQVNLKTFETKSIRGDFRVISIVEHNGKLYLGDEINSSITVLDEQTLKVEKKVPLQIRPIYIADENRSGNQHVQ